MYLYIFKDKNTGAIPLPYAYADDENGNKYIESCKIHELIEYEMFAKLPYSEELHLTSQQLLVHLGAVTIQHIGTFNVVDGKLTTMDTHKG